MGAGPTLAGIAKASASCTLAARSTSGHAASASKLPDARRWRINGRGVTRSSAHAAVTVAGGIAVPETPSGEWPLAAVRHAAGAFVTVAGEQVTATVASVRALGNARSEPAGAASIAGLRCAVRLGVIAAAGSAIALVTG